MHIHFLSNSLKVNSGFSNVTKNIALGLKKLGHDVTMSGLQTAVIPEYTYGIECLPLAGNLDEVSQFQKNIMQVNPDVVIYVGEVYTDVSRLIGVFPKICIYAPIEGSGVPNYVVNNLNAIVRNGGRVIAQCSYGYNEMKRAGINVDRYIYHGFNDKMFRVIKEKDIDLESRYCYFGTDMGKESIDCRELCRRGCYYCQFGVHDQVVCEYYKEELVNICKYVTGDDGEGRWTEMVDMPISRLVDEFKNKFVFLFVGQNHLLRKKINRLLEAFSKLIEIKQIRDRVILHLHCNPQSSTGLDLLELCNRLDIQQNVTFSYGTWRSSSWSENGLSILYNLANVNVSSTSSEGFCVLPDSPILTFDRGVQKIKDIKVGDRVLTHNGRFMRVSNVMKREYNGDMIELISSKLRIPVILTPEHLVLGIKTSYCQSNEKGFSIEGRKICTPMKKCYYTASNGKQYKHCKYLDNEEPWNRYKTKWINAKDLKEGDYVTYPISQEKEVDISKIKIRDYIDDFLNVTDYDKKQNRLFDYFDDEERERQFKLFEKSINTISMNASYSRKYAKIPSEVEVTKDLMRLFGYFIAEGDISDDRQVEFAFNINEIEYHTDVEKIMNNVFGLKPEHVIKEHNGTHALRYSNQVLANMFQNMFCPKEYEIKKKWKGKKSNIVRIPSEFLNLPLDKLSELIKGIWRGDGGKGTKGTSGYNISTTSETLAHQLVYLLTKFSILAGLRISDRNNKLYDNWSLQYIIDILGSNIDIFENIIEEKHQFRNVDSNISNYIIARRLIYIPIKATSIVKYEGEVWNLEVEEDNSYVSSIILHNCLPVLEGFATGLPMISTNCTSQTELVSDKILESSGQIGPRGLLARVSDTDMIIDMTTRSLVDIEDLSIKMKSMYMDDKMRESCRKNAIRFAGAYTWNNVVREWNKLLLEMSK